MQHTFTPTHLHILTCTAYAHIHKYSPTYSPADTHMLIHTHVHTHVRRVCVAGALRSSGHPGEEEEGQRKCREGVLGLCSAH